MTSNPGPRVIIVDDKDKEITYSSGWSQDDDSQKGFLNSDMAYLVAPTYQHTLHLTQTNSSFSFNFQGTAIHITGATNRNNGAANDPDPGPFSWVCAVDGKRIQISPEQPDFLYNLCASGNLTDGAHILTVNVTSGSSSFWLDSIQYVPSENSPALDTAVVLIDDSDPAIEYDVGWQRPPSFYNTTTTSIPGAQLSFKFTGKAVSWVTVMPADDPQLVSSSGSYTIDRGDPVQFNFSAVVDENPWGRIMFTTSDLTPGNHTLSVTYHGNSTVQAGDDDESTSPTQATLKPVDLSLDYLLVTHAPIPESTVSTSPAATHSVPTDKGQPDKTNKGINKAAIAGGVVAGLILLCSLFAIIFALHRRRRRRRHNRFQEIDVEVVLTPPVYRDTPLIVEPFYIVPEMRQAVPAPAVLKKNDANVGIDDSQEETGQTSSTSLEQPNPNPLQNRSSSSSLSGSNPQPPPPSRGVSRVLQHEDSGVRLFSEGSVVEVPPQYTET